MLLRARVSPGHWQQYAALRRHTACMHWLHRGGYVGVQPYSTGGEPCSQCPEGYEICESSLCSKSHPPPVHPPPSSFTAVHCFVFSSLWGCWDSESSLHSRHTPLLHHSLCTDVVPEENLTATAEHYNIYYHSLCGTCLTKYIIRFLNVSQPHPLPHPHATPTHLVSLVDVYVDNPVSAGIGVCLESKHSLFIANKLEENGQSSR